MKSWMKLVCVFVLVMLTLGACAPGAQQPAAVKGDDAAQTDDNAPITVWIDTTRQAAVDAFKAKYPDKAALIKEEIVDRGQFPSKVLLFNNTNQGWPDVVFAEPSIVGRVADAAHNFPLDLKGYVDEKVVADFGNAITPCWFDGKLFCLRNDVAQDVLYYNKPLMDEFGYAVPTTWEEYLELSDKVAAEHPGYIMGAFGEAWGWAVYYWGASCPLNEVVSVSQVRINPDDPRCAKASNLVDHMIANGTISKLDPFDPAFVQLVTENKLLMLPEASWFGEYIFGGKADSLYYKTAEGQLGVATPLKWKDEAAPVTATHGGSAWTVSRHTKNPKLAVEFTLFVTTADEYQSTGPTFPGYLPVADKWAKTIQSNPLYANDPYPIFKESVGFISALDTQPRYDWVTVVTKWVKEANQSGKTMAEVLTPMADELKSLAEAEGYEVVK